MSEVGSAIELDEAARSLRTGATKGDELADKVLVRDEHYSITERKNLPQAVGRIIEASGTRANMPFCSIRTRRELTRSSP